MSFPRRRTGKKTSPGLYKFYKDPEANPLPTPSGKLEIYSAQLAKFFPDDKERPPIPKWVEKSEMHDERISSTRAKVYPLLMMSNHGRWRVHAQCDDITLDAGVLHLQGQRLGWIHVRTRLAAHLRG